MVSCCWGKINLKLHLLILRQLSHLVSGDVCFGFSDRAIQFSRCVIGASADPTELPTGEHPDFSDSGNCLMAASISNRVVIGDWIWKLPL